MIINIKFKLIDNHQKWYQFDTEKVRINIIVRLFRALSSVSTYDEQKELLKKVNIQNGRNSQASITIHYKYKNDIAEVFMSNIDTATNKYTRGKKVDEIKI